MMAQIVTQMQAMAISTLPKDTKIPFPKWDGTTLSLSVWSYLLNAYMLDSHVSAAMDCKLDGNHFCHSHTTSNAVQKVFTNIPTTRLHYFINNPNYLGKGFKIH